MSVILESRHSAPAEPAPAFVDAFDGRYARIAHSDALPPFLMNVVSSSDLWLFLASNGGLSAGRVNAAHALFPYQTVDRIYDSAGSTGPFTAIRAVLGGREILWEPFASHPPHVADVIRHLYKSVEGDRVWFEETHPALQLVFRYGWSTAEHHGFVRRCELENLAATPRPVRLLDGLRNLLPPGIGSRLQADYSCLIDAYKTAERLPSSTLATYALSAAITDRPTPIESLRASIVWSEGPPDARILLSETQFAAFHSGAEIASESRRRGIRGVYALSAHFLLAPRATQRWLLVADTGLTQADVVARHRAFVSGELSRTLAPAVADATQTLRRFAAAADGLQCSAAEATTAHHFANVLFNILRGGTFAAAGISLADFIAFLRVRHRPAAERHAVWLASLPRTLPRAALLGELATRDDPDLERLGYEYLPLTFSRRHGDPSRPWNTFNIRMRDAAGHPLLNYEGNWRDIFQNWEALGASFPDYLESIVAKFLNASTADGYNPYRLSRAGLEWEVPSPDHPWAGIGYWGDHQTIYLLKLLEWSARFHPGLLGGWLRRDLFSSADVPYRIASYDAIRAHPQATIAFDAERHRAIEARVARDGTDARLVHAAEGRVRHVNLTEKLLLLVLTRLTNFIPGGGIWMNTQRPEWNDANNALVGHGVSLVTLAYLRRFLAHVRDCLLPALGPDDVPISTPLATLLADGLRVLDRHRALLLAPSLAPAARRALVDALGRAGSDFRRAVYAGSGPPRTVVSRVDLSHLLTTALAFVDHTLRGSRRDDGLFHAYNLLAFSENPPGLELRPLGPMLEGQVAVLSSGLLAPAEAVALLRALRSSPLYRADQHSYLLYPDRELPAFLDRNVIPESVFAACPFFEALLATGDTSLVLRDATGRARFHPDLVNATALDERLQILAADPRWRDPIAADSSAIQAAYETVFQHRAYTGRSSSMFGYEGLGSIYWHMVAKLLLAVQENFFAADAAGDPAAPELARLYHDLRHGLGFNKSPAAYGAFPTDPYSHTPGHAGAQQPGMTGQVKEEILTRFGELGVHVEHGALAFRPRLLRADEFTTAPTAFRAVDLSGREILLDLPAGAIGFTFCGLPIFYRRSTRSMRLQLHFADGRVREFPGTQLGASLSAEIFQRSGRIHHVEVDLGISFQPLCP